MNNDDAFQKELLRLSKFSSLELFRKYLLFKVACPLISVIDHLPRKHLWISFLAKHGFLSAFLNQFTGGQSIDSAIQSVRQLNDHQNRIILDFAAEAAGSRRDPLQHFSDNAEKIPKKGAVSLKMSTLINMNNLSRADKNAFIDRFSEFCKRMGLLGIKIMVDAEESEHQDLIDEISMKVMPTINTDDVILFNTYQMYRVDASRKLQSHLREAAKQKYGLGVKLVRGAYTEHERRTNPSVLYDTKEQVDENYNRSMQELIEHTLKGKHLSTMIATHNAKSVSIACDMLSSKFDENTHNIAFAQLFGMGNVVGNYVSGKGFPNYKYIPYGEVDDLVPYLLRRAKENSAFSGMAADEADVYFKALTSRRNR